MLHSGVDLHKRTVAPSTVAADGHAVRDAKLPTTREAWYARDRTPDRLAPLGARAVPRRDVR
jgi:hypothetical protein